MKATHAQIVNLMKGMGWIECEIYPDLKITVLKRGSEYMTVTKTVWERGRYEFI